MLVELMRVSLHRRIRSWIRCCALLLGLPILTGFDVSQHSIPPEEILSGGPPKDGIPAILDPRFVDAASAVFLSPDDVVIGIASEGVAKAYPLGILNWHEVVNDDIRGTPLAVTYCPLTDSAVVYDRRVSGKTLSFGVSGKLYQSNVLMYDHETESLWSQLGEKAVTGPLTGSRLQAVPAVRTAWADWRSVHPGTLVLSQETGHRREYERDPYAGYRESPEVMFPAGHVDRRLAPKERVFGFRVGDTVKAYALPVLAEEQHVEDQVGSRRVRIDYAPASGRVTAAILDTKEPLAGVVVYWFAWSAFHPDTALWGGAVAATPRPPKGAPSGSATGSAAAAIVEHAAYWTDFPGLGIGAGDGRAQLPGVLVIRGKIRNESATPLDHISLTFDLLNDAGQVVASEAGYNYGAETLRNIDSPVPVKVEHPPAIPVPPGRTDTFRMMFLRDEIPSFDSYRIRVTDAAPAAH